MCAIGSGSEMTITSDIGNRNIKYRTSL